MSNGIERVTAEILPPTAADTTGDGGMREAMRGVTLPRVIVDAGEDAAKKFIEYFTVKIANPRTRRAYATAITQFMRWCEERRVGLRQIEPLHVATYIRSRRTSKPTVNQHLAAIRTLCNWLVIHQIIRQNPAAAVKGPRQS